MHLRTSVSYLSCTSMISIISTSMIHINNLSTWTILHNKNVCPSALPHNRGSHLLPFNQGGNLHESQLVPQVCKRYLGQRLRQNISCLLISGDVLENHFSLLDFIKDKVVLDLNVRTVRSGNVVGRTIRRFPIWKRRMVRPTAFPGLPSRTADVSTILRRLRGQIKKK
jgi:hypothetical protein